jgi:3-hydroxyisobutyrate dehydrogenase-like beta-hydroxyacid dehydrogenase
MKIGFIGLGAIGAGSALNLLKGGYSIVVNTRTKDKAAPHMEAGAIWAETPQEVTEASDVIFTALPGPREVETVALGEKGIIEGASPNKVYFDLSTNSPTLIRRLHKKFSEKGMHVLDAPVSGLPPGKLKAIWVGGDERIFNENKPILDAMSEDASYLGPIGAGSIAKLVQNCTSFTINQVLVETFTMGVKAGIEPLKLWKALRKGAVGRRRTFDGMATHLLSGRFDPPDFALKLAFKDVYLSVELGREFNVPMRMASLTLNEFTEALSRGWGDRDMSSFMLLQEERSGVEIRAPQEKILEEIESDFTDS